MSGLNFNIQHTNSIFPSKPDPTLPCNIQVEYIPGSDDNVLDKLVTDTLHHEVMYAPVTIIYPHDDTQA